MKSGVEWGIGGAVAGCAFDTFTGCLPGLAGGYLVLQQ